MRKALLFLMIIAPLLFASQIWQYATEGPVSEKPKVIQGMLVVGSDDGNIYALDPAGGTKRWKTFVGKEPNEVFAFDNAIITTTTSGHVMRLDTSGKIIWSTDLTGVAYNATFIYGASANQKWIALSANNGIYLIDKNGSVRSKISSYSSSVVTSPASGDDFVIFGRGSSLFKVREAGTIEWESKISDGSFWDSTPVIDGSTVLIGALDNKMHAFSVIGGVEEWSARTRNWVESTPFADGTNVYFGSNDGSVYAVDEASGTPVWTTPMELGFASQPEDGSIGGVDTIFIGGKDTSVFALREDTGEVLWKGVTSGAVGSPLYYNNEVIFGSQDHYIYAFSTERACAITSPREAQVLGLKELKVTGNHVSAAGGSSVWVNINNADWQQANLTMNPNNTTGSEWVFYSNPTLTLAPGLNTISCKVVDSSGEESGDKFTTVTVNYDPTIALSNMVVSASPTIIEGKPFTVYVNDGDDGSPLERFSMSVGGKNYTGDNSINITIPSAGSYKATIHKIGFNDFNLTINVNSSGVNPLYVGIGILLILVIVQQMWSRFLSQKFNKPKTK